ncbi:MAG: (d)CMP kinase [Balneolaceae bacterium]
MIIVIDGLSGSGKSSTAKAVAERIGINYLDSGALYRVATWIWLENGETEEAFLDNLSSNDIRFRYEDREFHVSVNGRDITGLIRSERVSAAVSTVAANPEVRAFVNAMMRQAVQEGVWIADGRDLGTAVFPNAELKFFMKASIDVRARRRYEELLQQGEMADFNSVKQNLAERDRKDMSRKADPLKKPEDAIEIDTSSKTFDDQVNEICIIISKRLNRDISTT